LPCTDRTNLKRPMEVDLNKRDFMKEMLEGV